MLISILFIVLYTIPSCLISLLQIAHIKSNSRVAILSRDDFYIARDYAITCQYFSIFENIIFGILFVFWVNIGFNILDTFIGSINVYENVSAALYVVLFLVIKSIILFPVSAYKTLVIDKSFGFSKMTLGLYIIDSIKQFALLILFAFIISFSLIYFITSFANWWFFGFVFLFLLVVLINIIYPTLIAPIFNKFTPLDDNDLKDRISSMMQRVGFRANGIFVMDASRRDGRLNAYFGGIGRSKRVVLFDTLLSKVTHNELLAILGHELAHFKNKDLIKNIFIVAFVLFTIFFIAGNLPDIIFVNFDKNASTIICVIFLLSSPISFYFQPIMNYFSRKAEYKADKFGAELTNINDLGSALVKLINENKAFPYSHSVYTFFHMSHPPLIDRLRALGYDISYDN